MPSDVLTAAEKPAKLQGLKHFLSVILVSIFCLGAAGQSAPLSLQIAQAGTSVTVSWTNISSCAVLEWTANLNANTWVTNTTAPATVGDRLELVFPAGESVRYFRLHRPPAAVPTPNVLVNGQWGDPGDGSGAEWVSFDGCTPNPGCLLQGALAADTTNIFDASYSIDWARCSTNDPTMTFQWVIRYPQDNNNGIVYTSALVEGRNTAVLTLPPNSFPNVLGSGYWRAEVTMTSQVQPELTKIARFQFRYLGSEW